MTKFTPFWTSTPQARRRTAKQQRKRERQRKRQECYNPDLQMKIALPQTRFRSVRRQISVIKKKLPYKLRKPELQQLQMFLARTPNLQAIILPKQRCNKQPLNFSDSAVKWLESEEKE